MHSFITNSVAEVAVTVVDVVVPLIALGFDIFQLVNNLVQSRGPGLYSPVKLPPNVINRECVTVCVCVCMHVCKYSKMVGYLLLGEGKCEGGNRLIHSALLSI